MQTASSGLCNRAVAGAANVRRILPGTPVKLTKALEVPLCQKQGGGLFAGFGEERTGNQDAYMRLSAAFVRMFCSFKGKGDPAWPQGCLDASA